MQYGRMSQTETETVLHWFLHRMPMEQRHQLMAELPIHYAKLFPGVSPAVVSGKVLDQLLEMQGRRLRDTETHCHCGAAYDGSDHCPRCGCEQFESTRCGMGA